MKKTNEFFEDEECTECDVSKPRFKLILANVQGDVVDYLYLCDECVMKLARRRELRSELALDLSRCK